MHNFRSPQPCLGLLKVFGDKNRFEVCAGFLEIVEDPTVPSDHYSLGALDINIDEEKDQRFRVPETMQLS